MQGFVVVLGRHTRMGRKRPAQRGIGKGIPSLCIAELVSQTYLVPDVKNQVLTNRTKRVQTGYSCRVYSRFFFGHSVQTQSHKVYLAYCIHIRARSFLCEPYTRWTVNAPRTCERVMTVDTRP